MHAVFDLTSFAITGLHYVEMLGQIHIKVYA